MTSLWLDQAPAGNEAGTDTASVPKADVVVVGAGLTGLVTAVRYWADGSRTANIHV